MPRRKKTPASLVARSSMTVCAMALNDLFEAPEGTWDFDPYAHRMISPCRNHATRLRQPCLRPLNFDQLVLAGVWVPGDPCDALYEDRWHLRASLGERCS